MGLRKYYLFAAVVFSIGAVLAIVKGNWTALVVFVVLAASMGWIASRVDRVVVERERRPDDPGAARRR